MNIRKNTPKPYQIRDPHDLGRWILVLKVGAMNEVTLVFIEGDNLDLVHGVLDE